MWFWAIPWECDAGGELHSTQAIGIRWPLLATGLVLIVATFVAQLRKPAPYGRFDAGDAIWGPRVPQRIAHILNDGLYGVLAFLWFYLKNFSPTRDYVITVFISAWLMHFIHRGFVHPITAKYSQESVTIGIPATGLTLAFFSYIHADFFISCEYRPGYIFDPRFLIGATFFTLGFAINRWADWKLREIRVRAGNYQYQLPRGGLFDLVSCPNYFGELVQWIGWAIATNAPCAFLYTLFTAATFFPRSLHNHNWYIRKFKSYPKNRKSLIPYVF